VQKSASGVFLVFFYKHSRAAAKGSAKRKTASRKTPISANGKSELGVGFADGTGKHIVRAVGIGPPP